MCLLVWVGSQRPLERVIVEGEATIQVEDVPADEAVRAHLTSPCIAYVGAYEGCGCGFQSDGLWYEGIASVAEAVALEDALLPQEREDFHQSQRSRAALHRLVVDAALHGEVELVAFWAGEQSAPLVHVETRDAAWLIDHLVPFVERTKYLVHAC
ncbi:MAG: hypothetical protein Q8S73_12300 [Deltaproteobacteria bacterium]|nr:hypothetical protein [Myxococcales bacterium]MDP3214880.1 hypothetical protein [Deltaproteobacteria bacterium]